MAAISINDNLMMCVALHEWLVVVLKIHEIELWNVKFLFTLLFSPYKVLHIRF